MILVSIHPFALRRLALVVLAIAGFSALCFADPVLMTHRYSFESRRSHGGKTAPVQPSLVTAWNPTVTLEKATANALDSFADLVPQPADWRMEALGGVENYHSSAPD